jgi:hypothetical protein
MLLWLLCLLLLASLAGLGFRQGAIRVAFSLVGILVGACLAGPLGNLLKRPLMAVGLKNPTLVWLLGPLIVFILISIIFKLAAMPVHLKADVFYKYKAGDLRLALYERLSHRLGLCLGLANGAAYFTLISMVIYSLSYWTIQVANSETDATSVKILNNLGRDLESSGFAKVARALDPMPESYYDAGDIAGLVYRNPLIEARLTRYPAFLGLAERAEFKDLANDAEFAQMLQKQEPIRTVLDYPKLKAIASNPDLLQEVWTILKPDLKDLPVFLQTGKSPKYDQQKILGRWNFNVNSAFALVRLARPNTPTIEMQKVKRWMQAAFHDTSFVAMPDHAALLKNIPTLKLPPAALTSSGPQTLQGQWKDLDDKYQLSFSSAGAEGDLMASVEGDRLTMKGQGVNLVFDRED